MILDQCVTEVNKKHWHILIFQRNATKTTVIAFFVKLFIPHSITLFPPKVDILVKAANWL